MSPRHVAGTSLPNQGRARDRQAVARAGCSTPTEADFDPAYSSDDLCWPVDESMVLGLCPVHATPLYDLGTHRLSCAWGGCTFPWPDEEGPS